MSDYNFDPNESSFIYPFVRDIAMDKHTFSKETIKEIEDSYNILRKYLKKVSLDDKVTYSECRGFVYNPDKFNLK